MSKVPVVLAHRGASGYAEENSLKAIRLAREMEADGVEIDIQPSRDGGFLLRHDPLLPDERWIREVTLDEALSAFSKRGTQVPTLAQALQASVGLEVWVEVKHLHPQNDGLLLDAIDAAPDTSRVAVHSFDHRIVARLGQLRPSLPRGVLSSARLRDPLAALESTGARTLWQEWTLIDEELVRTMGGAGVAVVAWTVNSAAVALRLADMGVTGLCGNYPDRLRPRTPSA